MNKLFISALLSLVAGCFYALCYPSHLSDGIFPFLFIALPLFLWLLQQHNLKESLLIITCYNLGLNLVGYYWIPATLREFGNLPYPLSVLLGLLFTFILQPHWWIYAVLKKYIPSLTKSDSYSIALTAIGLTLLERFIPQQFASYVGSPWLTLAPYLGLVPYFGVMIFSFVSFWISLEAIEYFKTRNLRLLPWSFAILFVLLNVSMPLQKNSVGEKISVRIVQPNIGNFIKLSSENGDGESTNQVNNIYHELSTRPSDKIIDLIIWPETAHPGTFYGEHTQLERVFMRILEETGAEMLIGGYELDPNKDPSDFVESVFNSSILLSNYKVKSSYHKNILIPFGETLPFGPLNKEIIKFVPAVSLFAKGESTPLMETKDGHRFVTPICYEILDSDFTRSLLNQWGKNKFIVNHTNDSWYGKTTEPYQHLFLSRWRALEFNLPVIRSTNTGITSIIYPDGSESKRLLIGEQNILDIELDLGKGEATFYQNYGILSSLLIFALILLISFFLKKN